MVRVRIAPSPTGIPHIGNTRTALFNWLFARHNKGKFVLRIEDTDRERLVPESINAIYEILDWLGLSCDEGPNVGGEYGPYVQSERLAIYQKYAQQLVASGAAYYCFCTSQRLEKIRHQQIAWKKPPKYDRLCLRLSAKEVKTKIIKGELHVVRMKIPDDGKTSWQDLIHGPISFDNVLLDDSVILKSDGFPTYHLAVVIDDHLMKISHVLRGDEWISSTPKHLLLYQSLRLTPAKFGHFPLILGSDKAKLSKRHGAVSVLEYRDRGYLPEALINFMALLGWNPKTNQEIFAIGELVEQFDLTGINPTSPIFNLEKLNWFNSQWIRKLPGDELVARLEEFIPKKWNRELVKTVLPLVIERIKTLAEFPQWTDFLFEEPKIDTKFFQGASMKDLLNRLVQAYQTVSSWKKDELEKIARSVVAKLQLDNKEVFMILRLAITGKSVGPPLFESIEILGKDKTFQRLKNATGKS